MLATAVPQGGDDEAGQKGAGCRSEVPEKAAEHGRHSTWGHWVGRAFFFLLNPHWPSSNLDLLIAAGPLDAGGQGSSPAWDTVVDCAGSAGSPAGRMAWPDSLRRGGDTGKWEGGEKGLLWVCQTRCWACSHSLPH